MLGNDVVDFSIDEKKYTNQRFINRILTKIEQQYLYKADDKNAFLWSLWSAKEASYKSYQKQNLGSLFSPIKFEISENTLIKIIESNFKSPVNGIVIYKNVNVAALIPVAINWPTETCVHCVSTFTGKNQIAENLHCKLMKLQRVEDYTVQSLQVRALAKLLLEDHNINAEIVRPEIKVKDYKKAGPPRLIFNNQLLNHEISLSHDGRWLAVALLIINPTVKAT
jgi:phosphopantetheine--protein transferase-like protein